MLKERAEYDRLLKSLDTELGQILSRHIDKLLTLINSGGLSVNDFHRLANDLQQEIHDMIKSNSVIAIDFAKKVKAADLKPYLAEVQRLLVARNVAKPIIEEATSLNHISLVFGGGLDDKILDAVWNKVWPDALNVDDRIKLLSKKAMKFTEMTVKQGISEGRSAADISKDLRQHFEVEGVERKAAFRLAAHTTNMCYQEAQAEISVSANFVMGIRINRGVYGPASENCDICEEHGGPADGDGKEYRKSDFGGDDADMYVMANMPGYHPNCNCGIETIYEDAITFVKNALQGTNDSSSHSGWKLS
ncbi:hypothetical protein Ga0466249_004828 [Sporomusaceae bacterium BoRhaA]|uniref:phage head morphogenesis protein n=1 Tax=Pelorhabdus rhamnosifermentans TaxID=2772457 RepID=UPI001C05FA5E|nr:phage head morphogenesis protein [Pelorhabdus rhamnosifermentans]MBU2703680.1 hypothetical protein [Pelorhabdus rhamnosifermentans]